MLNRKNITVMLAMIVVAAAGYLFVTARTGSATQKRTTIRQGARTIPRLDSKVKGVVLESAKFGDGDEFTEFTVRNDTQRSITSVTLRAGKFSLLVGDMDTPPFILPGERHTSRIPTDNIADDAPVVLVAASFDDGSVRGTPDDVEEIKSNTLLRREERKKGGRQ
ncbi:MAG TPA: hypothetical protein VIQ24_24295 [Pyrinomonadaceae bacterium]